MFVLGLLSLFNIVNMDAMPPILLSAGIFNITNGYYVYIKNKKLAIFSILSGLFSIFVSVFNPGGHEQIVNTICSANEIPDGERTITMNLYENVFEFFDQAVFDSIRESDDFIGIMNKLKDLGRKSFNDIAASRVMIN